MSTQKAHTRELAAIRQMSWGIGRHNGERSLRWDSRRVSRLEHAHDSRDVAQRLFLQVTKSKHSSSSSDSHSAYSQRNSTNASPRLTSSDLGLDPSDPVNLLLHNTSQCSSNASGDSSMEYLYQGGSPPDWSQLWNRGPSLHILFLVHSQLVCDCECFSRLHKCRQCNYPVQHESSVTFLLSFSHL